MKFNGEIWEEEKSVGGLKEELKRVVGEIKVVEWEIGEENNKR